MKNKKDMVLLKVVCIFLISTIVVLILDYFNIFNFITKNLNFDFLNIFINSIIVIFIFVITYILVEQKSFDIQKNIEQKKIKVLVTLILRMYYKCIENINLLQNQELLEKYIIPKCDFNSTNDPFVNNFKNYPFDFENRVIDLMQTGIMDVEYLDNYLIIKDLYRKYIDMRITFFDIKNSNIKDRDELLNLIDVDKNDLTRKLKHEINKLLKIKKDISI